MIKKLNELSDNEIFSHLDKTEKACNFCDLSDYCKRRPACYGDLPVFPACSESEDVVSNIVEDYKDWCHGEGITEIDIDDKEG